jgi:hypothetical protein
MATQKQPQAARKLDIQGRSKMGKAQRGRAVARAK